MELRLRFSPGDNVWFMFDNKPVRKVITAIQTYSCLNEKDLLVHIVKYSFDRDHAVFIDASKCAETKEELKEKIFG